MGRVALIGENSAEYVSKLLDIWNNGDCAVLLDWRIPLQTAIKMMHEAAVAVCYIEKKLYESAAVDKNIGISFITYEIANNLPRLLEDCVWEKYHENYSCDEAVVIYSSGTTGESKGIILSHFAITTNADSIIDYMNPRINDCLYTVRSLSHSSTITGELLVALKTRCKYLLSPTVVPPRYILRNIKNYHVTIICLNPTILSMIVDEYRRGNESITPLKTIYVSGSILNNDIYNKALNSFGDVTIYNVYGLSEASPRVTAQRADCCRTNSVGKPIKGVKVMVVDESGTMLGPGKNGVVYVNTPSIYSGYICGKKKHTSLYEGWLNTGDIGYFDENGELHIVSRIDDVININGHKIYSNEVAMKIQKYADVDECLVTNVCYDGEECLCCIYSSSVDIDNKIKNKLCRVLMKHEIPRIFVRTVAIPKTRNGKISSPLVKEVIFKEMERRKKHDL